MRNLSMLVMVASLSFIAGVGLTYVARTPWSSDMADQPSIKPQEQPRLPPGRSVPTDQMGRRLDSGKSPQSEGGQTEMGHSHGPGSAGTPEHHHDSSGASEGGSPKMKNPPHDHGDNKTPGHTPDHSTHSHGPEQSKGAKAAEKHSHDARSGSIHAHDGGKGEGHAHGDGASSRMRTVTPKPVKATPTSIRQGEELFNIYCAACHGSDGQGGMPMEKALSGIPKFTPQLLQRESDPHMFSMVTSGHGPMPGYAEALMPEERWHVINYLRSLQSKLAEREHSRKGGK